MSKTYIVSRNGGTVTKAPINDNKIPIYDTEADAEADFANIEEGQLYATKEDKFDVDDMKQYIRNQNILSEWEDITISTDSNNPTVFDKDGFFLANYQSTSDVPGVVWFLNGIDFHVGCSGSNYNANGFEFTIPIKKGDTLYRASNWAALYQSKVAYYKLRDYSDR